MTNSIKPKVAFFDFTSCEGCQLTVIDSLQTHPELLDVVDIVEFREAMSEKSDSYDIAFIEGSLTLEAAIDKIKVNTRRFAKRQMTWFSKDPEIQWYTKEQIEDVKAFLNETL